MIRWRKNCYVPNNFIIRVFSSGTCCVGGMAWVVDDVKIYGVCMHVYVIVIPPVLYKINSTVMT